MKSRPPSGVEGALQRALARALDARDVRVSLLGKVAHLEGSVPSLHHKSLAAETVRLLSGVSEVVNRLRVAPSLAAGDRALREAVLRAVRTQLKGKAEELAVLARQGVVHLKGTVASLADRCAAECAAWSVGGVVDIRNSLAVKGRASSPESLARQLRQALGQCLPLDPAAIQVLARGDTVFLRGRVPSPYHRLAAEDLVRAHSQVREVVNELLAEDAAAMAQRDQSRASA